MAELRNFDLNLLVAFDLLMKERNVSRAAEKMFITQSTMSHVLQRLRQQLEDPLLLKTPSGMMPTARALALVEPVAAILKEVEALIRLPESFDPATSRRRFVIAATDYIEALVMPKLVEKIAEQAPGTDIHFKRTSTAFPAGPLERGETDVLLGFEVMLNPPKYFNCEILFTDYMVCMSRLGHPQVSENLSLDDYIALPHILVSRIGSSTGQVDAWLAEHGRERRVALTVSHFLTAPLIAAQSNMVAAYPRRTAELFTGILPLQLTPLPLDLPDYATVMVWHPLQDREPAQIWLREEIRKVCQRMGD